MADEASNGSNPFDVHVIGQLVALMSEHDLSEIHLRQGGASIRLRRGAPAPGMTIPAPLPAAPASSLAPPTSAAPTGPERPLRRLHEIKSPVVGTFYSRPNPESPPYVTVGSRVTPTTVVCQVEAMKIFNEIQAECSGVIEEILVENQQAVEYNQVLFRVNTES